MSKWLSARVIALIEGEHEEIDDDEQVVGSDWNHPNIWLIVAKVSPRRPEQIDGDGCAP